ncbi:MAG: hypothetical protein HXY41_11475 [Chloroflexi bacterium]|nr:hypothetical protein [Chloroflexota bacterium]
MNCRWIVHNLRRLAAGSQPSVKNPQLSTLSPQYAVRCILLLILLAACQPGTTTPAAPTPAVLEVKQLATVYISPTPDESQLQATRRAVTATPGPPTAQATPTATAYIGIFIGEVLADEGPVPGLEQLAASATLDFPATRLPTCTIPPDAVFGAGWGQDAEVPQRLGCPIQIVAQFRGTAQVFERGAMYWRGDTGEIWAIVTSGPSAGRYWTAQQSGEEANADILVPEGLRVPVRGFGWMWRSVPEVRDALGFARTDEQELAMQSQRFESGLLLLDSSSGLVFALIVDGTAYGPFGI